MDIVEKVKSICKERKIPISRLEKDCGFSNGYIRSLKNGTFPADRLNTISKYLDVPMQTLMGENEVAADNRAPRTRTATVINVLGHVAAGIPIEAITDIVDTEEISEQLARCGEYFGLRIKGDSMEPGIKNGDTVIVRQQPDAESGEVVVAIVNGNDGVCKRLRKYGRTLVLESDNHAYEPMSYEPQEVEDIPVRIAGKVVELRRKL